MPGWVVDYVLVHELAHLIEIGHGPRFYRLVDAYPKAERARGYLLGVVAGAGWSAEPDALDEESAYEAGADEAQPELNAQPEFNAQPELNAQPEFNAQRELDALW